VADPDALVARVRELADERRLFGRRDRLIVAVSGGADSVCLLDVLCRLRQPAGRGLVAVHVDHGFRADAAADAAFVAELAGRMGVPSEIARVDGPGYARAHKLGIEQAGRALRYRALAAAAERHDARAIATGHTADDSVESFLMHLLRGTGLEGLRGIAATEDLRLESLGPAVGDVDVRAATVVRPLLGLRRAETAAYCAARNLSWTVDPTNDDPAFLRNRVRHHLLPLLRTYNPAIDTALTRTADLLRQDNDWLEVLVTRRWAGSVTVTSRGLEFDARTWRRQPRAAQRRLLRRAAAHLGASGDGLGFDAVERAVEFIAADRPRQIRLAGRLAISRCAGRLRLSREDCERA
jgi:tRNA(Ile)-lysidine synthetase-like protein